MLTGVIYGAIVVVWAAYLVPLALRRHDEASRARSIERFSSAMRVLARRGGDGSRADERTVVSPPRSEPRVAAPAAREPARRRILVTPERNRAAEAAAAARRRRVLALLAAATVVVGIAGLVGKLPRLAVVVPLLMIVGFLVIARVSVRRATEPHWVEVDEPADARSETEGTAVVVRRPAARVERVPEVPVDPAMDAAEDEPTITLTAAQRALAATGTEDAVATGAAESADGASGSLWDPLPVTLPAYVGAPVAKRTIRTIELGEPGTWTSGHDPAAADSAQQPAESADTDATASEQAADDDAADDVAQVVNG